MKIGIDARLIEETGVGRYLRNLISEVSRIDVKNTYVVFLPKKAFSSFVLPNARWKKVLADVHWHTFSEQVVMPRLFTSEKLDLVHIPYHNPPVMYQGRMVITIHDLTILHFSTGKATTLPWPVYQLKRLGYWIELWLGLRKAKKIIAVSETTKQEIIEHFHIPDSRISVTYEGVDSRLSLSSNTSIPLIQQPYALYVGNAYPHKNLETLVSAFEDVVRTNPGDTQPQLVLVGAEDYFYRRLKTMVHQKNLQNSIVFFGVANDSQLANLYTHARVFVFPSLMEGFGLPPLEALSCNCPVLASDIGIFHEILGDQAQYFDPHDPKALSRILVPYLNEHAKEISPPSKKPMNFSWSRMAKETLAVYESSTRI